MQLKSFVSQTDIVVLTLSTGKRFSSSIGPYVANLAKSQGVFTISVSYQPFSFEGKKILDLFNETQDNLVKSSDIVISIKKQLIFNNIAADTSFISSINKIKTPMKNNLIIINEIINYVQTFNIDLSDLKSICVKNGYGLITEGESANSTENPVLEAFEKAMSKVDSSQYRITGNVLLNIKGGNDLSLSGINECCSKISTNLKYNSSIKYGLTMSNEMKNVIVQVIASGLEKNS